MINPVFSKDEIFNMSPTEICDIVTNIINSSLYNLVSKNEGNNFKINEILKLYENSVFNNDEYTQELLNNKIDYNCFLSLIDSDDVINLKWLKSLADIDVDIKKNREEKLLKFPIEKVIIVEGLTEEILLPFFSKFLGYDFYAKGMQIISAGGKNQVVKLYYKLCEELKIPIFLLLDKDAENNIREITPRLRDKDKIHLVSCGEFEDLLPQKLIIKTFNNEFKNFLPISEADFEEGLPYAKVLENVYKTIGLHEFKKADFARLVRENISSQADISNEIRDIVKEISENNS